MIYSFEKGMPAGICAVNSCIRIDREHRRDGEHSLLWEMDGNAELSIKGDVGYHMFREGGSNQDRDNYVFWLYRKEPKAEPLHITFLKNGRVCCHFKFGQQFRGWRTCWVPYEDMEGTPEEGMDEIRLISTGNERDSVWIDQMISSVPIDPRHPVPDRQVPFVNPGVDVAVNAHWTSLLRFSRLEEEALLQAEGSSEELEKEAKRIEERLEAHFLAHTTWPVKGNLVVTEDECSELCAQYDRFALRRGADGLYSGVTVDAGCQKAACPKEHREELNRLTGSVDMKECSLLLLNTAYAWQAGNREQKRKLADCYIRLLCHLWEQGWAAGSSLGTTHHLGYPMRSLYPSVFLMREALEEAGLLEQASDMIGWFSGRGRIFRKPEELEGESVDTLNTLLQGILCSILLMKNPAHKECCLFAMSRWLSTSLQPAPGLAGPFKADGSAFHHANHYPAYAMGGFMGAAPVVYALSQTRFRLGKAAHRTMRKSLLYMRIYSNRYNWLVSMSSRHPKGIGEMSQISSVEPFYYMALAGEDSGGQIDKEMAGALLRLAEYVDFPQAQKLKELGYEAEPAPEGHFSMNYACAGIHRRQEWMAGVRGHSRYLWGNETYEKNNLYGRYITYGNLQILGNGQPVNNAASGFWQEGWDWNYFPGTTSVVLPWEELKQRVCVVDATAGFEEMLLSDEAFAGGVSFQGKQGAFGMKLHGHAKYDGSLRARKSWFFFEDRIICLGSDIEDGREQYPTVTTLYQYYLEDTPAAEDAHKSRADVDRENVMTPREELVIMDPGGNRYRIPAGSRIGKTRGMQESRAQDTGAVTVSPFEKVWLDHGHGPVDAGYEYMIRVQAVGEEPEQLPYAVMQKDSRVHAVYDTETGISGYVFFEPGEVKQAQARQRAVAFADAPCLIMEAFDGKQLSLSFCDPDLRLYEGVEADQKNPDGTQKEVSLYSRKWLHKKSIGRWTTVTLRGNWKLEGEEREEIKLVEKQGWTEISFLGQDGRTIEVTLV